MSDGDPLLLRIRPHAVKVGTSLIVGSNGAEWLLIREPRTLRCMAAGMMAIVALVMPFTVLQLSWPLWGGNRTPHMWVPIAAMALGFVLGGLVLLRTWPMVAYTLLTDDVTPGIAILEKRGILAASRRFDLIEMDGVHSGVVRFPFMTVGKKATITTLSGAAICALEEGTTRAAQRVSAAAATGLVGAVRRGGPLLQRLAQRLEPVRRAMCFDFNVLGPEGEPMGYVSLATTPDDPSLAEIKGIDPRVVVLTVAVMVSDVSLL